MFKAKEINMNAFRSKEITKYILQFKMTRINHLCSPCTVFILHDSVTEQIPCIDHWSIGNGQKVKVKERIL